MNSEQCDNSSQSFMFQSFQSYRQSQIGDLFQNQDFALKNNQISIFDVQEQLQRIQSMIIQENEEEIFYNISLLKQIKDNVIQYKSQLSTQIEKYTDIIDQYIEFIINQKENFLSKIFEIPLINQIVFCQQYQEIENQTSNYAEIKNTLIKQLDLFNSQIIVNELEKHLNEFGLKRYKYSTEILENVIQQNQDKLIDLQCEYHKSQIQMIHLKNPSLVPRRLACLTCVEENPGEYIRIERFYYEWQTQQQRKLSQLRNTQQTFVKAQTYQIQQFSNFQFQINDLILQHKNDQNKNIQNYLQQVEKLKQQESEIWSQINNQRMNEIVETYSNQTSMIEFENKHQSKLNIWKQNQQLNYNTFFVIILNQLKDINPDTQLTTYIKQFEQKQSNFSYRLLNQSSVKQQDQCYAIAISTDTSIIVVSCEQLIKVHQFEDEILIEVQVISEHQKQVYCLVFMKYSYSFISGSEDNSIRIWGQKKKNLWICQQKLQSHLDSIFSLIISKNDDLIISGSKDSTIKIWDKQSQYKIVSILKGKKEWQCKQTITSHTESVFSLALNEQSNYLISCGKDYKIIVFKEQEIGWIQQQIIHVKCYGLGISFINNHTFCFQPQYHNKIDIYNLNFINYTKTKEISVKIGGVSNNLFPQQMIKSKQLIINKNGTYVNFIKIDQNSDIVSEYSIQFSTPQIFGKLSDNGEYLFTWDFKSKEIQIWKYNE
ncbi:unnamed protein product [Paramecium pentaurelia]|uniref:WD domain, G-beta repeat protein n=1 Tax=Paramecium pentaurelia TaxID=43138 RepID=A0A8S1UKB8_9CILI|nr:unnamed protein product [Paramecium pentaurelia]